MAYHDDLLDQAIRLVQEDALNPKQASLRRAVSTAYYAVFHLLAFEATSNYSKAHLQTALARAFDHGTMKVASRAVSNPNAFSFMARSSATVEDLRFIARTFVQLQDQRQFADYNLTEDLDQLDAVAQVLSAAEMFDAWQRIKHEDILGFAHGQAQELAAR